MSETCGVCWGSHACRLPPRHGGDHACRPDDPEPCETCPRTGPVGYGDGYAEQFADYLGGGRWGDPHAARDG